MKLLIARIFLKNAKIVLWDERDSEMPTEMDTDSMELFDRVRTGRTTFIIT